MTTIAYEPADILSSIASPGILALLRSMSDGMWATADQLHDATGVAQEEIAIFLHNLEMGGCLESFGNHFRMNCAGVRDTLSSAASAFTQELRAA